LKEKQEKALGETQIFPGLCETIKDKRESSEAETLSILVTSQLKKLSSPLSEIESLTKRNLRIIKVN